MPTSSAITADLRDTLFVVLDGDPHRERRLIPLAGTHNFRDLGGYTTADGRSVRWGRAYRSDHLGKLTDESQAALRQMGIVRVFDLRTGEEHERHPDLLPDGVRYDHTPVFDRHPFGFLRLLWMRNRLYKFFEEYYRLMVDQAGPVFGGVLKELADEANLPVVWHCTAGKDRAGMTAALTLLALGVSEEDVITDYTVSNLAADHLVERTRRQIEKYSMPLLKLEHMLPTLAAPPSLIRMAIDYIKDQYGSVEDYVTGPCGLDRTTLERLRENLLE